MARGSILSPEEQVRETVTYDIKYRTADGTQVKRAIGPNADAQRALERGLGGRRPGREPDPNRETFAEAADRWLARKRPRIEAATYRGYEIICDGA